MEKDLEKSARLRRGGGGEEDVGKGMITDIREAPERERGSPPGAITRKTNPTPPHPPKKTSGALGPRAPTRLTASLESSPLPPLRNPLVPLLLAPPPGRAGPITGRAAPLPPLGVSPDSAAGGERAESPVARAWSEDRRGQRRLLPHAIRTAARPGRRPERPARARPTPAANGAPSGHDRRGDEGGRKRGAAGAPASRRSGHQPQAGRGRAQGEGAAAPPAAGSWASRGEEVCRGRRMGGICPPGAGCGAEGGPVAARSRRVRPPVGKEPPLQRQLDPAALCGREGRGGAREPQPGARAGCTRLGRASGLGPCLPGTPLVRSVRARATWAKVRQGSPT